LDEALTLLAQYRAEARVIAGGTDLLLEIEKSLRSPRVLVDITRIPGLGRIRLADGIIHLGPLVTHNAVIASAELVQLAFPLAKACLQVGAPQIRNRATVAGNLITASPANDTITPLWALGASVTLSSLRGERTLSFAEFFKGVRKTALEPDEMLTDISFPAMAHDEHGTFLKLGLRKTQAISVLNVAAIVATDGKTIRSARIALGAVAPTIVRATPAETFLQGKTLDAATVQEAARLAMASARPISDVRSPASYRSEMVYVLTARALQEIRDGKERDEWPEAPAMLWGAPGGLPRTTFGVGTVHAAAGDAPIVVEVNGQTHTVQGANDRTLLQVLREDIGLTGTKEGCGEGECGACTVHLDGAAVLACLVPAAAAHGRRVVTIEGLSEGTGLHPVQKAFVAENAVQCGYCTPGFVMAGAKLLEEFAQPSRAQVEQAISGNLCRCTGYVNIVRAIEKAAERSRPEST
jgi:carbon-monoxide dehydrogenase medium subunit